MTDLTSERAYHCPPLASPLYVLVEASLFCAGRPPRIVVVGSNWCIKLYGENSHVKFLFIQLQYQIN